MKQLDEIDTWKTCERCHGLYAARLGCSICSMKEDLALKAAAEKQVLHDEESQILRDNFKAYTARMDLLCL